MSTDIETLDELNRSYLASVVDGDVACFDRILAPDFLCTGPDGSFLDKREFLEHTARPRTLARLVADDVRIRVEGEVAIIQAGTAFTTLAGHEGRGRYTDIWAKRDGRWLAVAAHVTRLS